jgi:hypothetical protein
MDKKLTTTIEISALAVSYSAVVSVVYEFFFFLGLGTDLSHTPLNPVDFLRGWMEWANTGQYIFFVFLTHLLIRKLESWKTEEEIVASSSSPELTRKIRNSPHRYIIWLGGILLMKFLIVGEIHYQSGIIGIIITSIIIFDWIVDGSPQSSNIFNAKLPLFWFALIFCGLNAFKIGTSVYDARTEPLYVTKISSGKYVEVVRVFDQWSLVRLDKREFAWVFHQSDREIKFSPERHQFIGAYCYFWQEYSSTKPHFCSQYRHLAVQ